MISSRRSTPFPPPTVYRIGTRAIWKPENLHHRSLEMTISGTKLPFASAPLEEQATALRNVRRPTRLRAA
ncbi:hypothetical protein X962_5928 [Burkholderia pseudomallei MSHR7343]|nr:hypothetical protein X948_5661 [Burkholderia pseudomallei MSHR5608]KGS19353.1 hypothetical protein X962_5928 [Burkholderia pseudomallei MSHR7343]KGS73383.1 hypothetical protein X947_5814 [Burkholderia pseudomallei MSHR7334]